MHTHKKYGLNKDSSKYGIDNVTGWKGKRAFVNHIQSNTNIIKAVYVKDNSTADQNKPNKYVYLNRGELR